MNENDKSLISTILLKICYTPLVYERINKKLNTTLSQSKIENFILQSIKNATSIEKRGKNYYVNNIINNVSITINSNNFRVITVNKICKNKLK
jgi:hypothetical protein